MEKNPDYCNGVCTCLRTCIYVILHNHVECTEYYRCHHKLSPMNNNHILDIQMMSNVLNQLILCGLSMMTPWRSLIMRSFPRTSLTVHTVCYLAQTLNKRKCAIKLKSLFPIWLNCRFGSSVCYFYSGTAEGFTIRGHGYFVKGKCTVTNLANFCVTPLFRRPQGSQGCLEKQNHPLISNLVLWCAKIGPKSHNF